MLFRVLVGLVSIFGTLSVPLSQAQLAADEHTNIFYPYRDSSTSVDGLQPGTRVSAETWQAAEQYLPDGILNKIQAGELAFDIQSTTDLPVSDAYISATAEHSHKVELDPDGELSGYVAGLPFPILSPDDGQAGVKAAWNLRHRDFGTIMQIWNTWRLVGPSGNADREIENYYVVAYGMHRPHAKDSVGTDPNIWNAEGLLYKEYFHILAPFDLKNTISLKHRHLQDQKPDGDWVYSPAGRKVRKVIVRNEDAAFDSAILNEDYFCFSGYVHSHRWNFLGSRTVLAPVGLKGPKTTYGGRAGWYPVDPWELRKVVVLEGIPQTANHPYSKRVLYIDQQMFVPLYMLAYNQDGDHIKTMFEMYGDPKFNPGNEHIRVPVWTGETMIDHEREEAAVTELTKVIYNEPMPKEFFDLNKIVARGR